MKGVALFVGIDWKDKKNETSNDVIDMDIGFT
jgi:hypothetical protein